MNITSQIKSRLKAEYFCKDEDILKVVGMPRKDAWYAAVQSGDEVYGVVALVTLDGLNPTRIKLIDEMSGPYAFGAPSDLLEILTETTHETALMWRANCRKVIAGEEIFGDPYVSFTHDFDNLPEGVSSMLNEAERAAYEEGMQSRLNGVGVEDLMSGKTLTSIEIKKMDGWMYMNNQIELQQHVEDPAAEGAEPVSAPPVDHNGSGKKIPIFFAKPGELTKRFDIKEDDDPGQHPDFPEI